MRRYRPIVAAMIGVGLLALGVAPGSVADAGESAEPRELVDRHGILTLPGDLSSIESFRWSPDGRRIAAAGYDSEIRLRIFIARRGKFRPVTAARLDARSFGWMPDSTSLLVAFDDRSTSSTEAVVHTELAVVDLRGDVLRSIPLDRELRAWYGITVSSDGKRAVVSGGGSPGPAGYDFDPGLIEIDLESGETRDIALREGFFGYDPRFIDDRSIVFFETCGIECVPRNQHATTLDLDTGVSQQITPAGIELLDLTVVKANAELLFVGFRERDADGATAWTVPLSGGETTGVPAIREIQALDAQPQGEFVLYRSYDRVTRHGRPGRVVRFHLVEYPSFEPV